VKARGCRCHSHNGFVLRPSEEGLAQREIFRPEGVDVETGLLYIDTVGSVSGLRRDEDMFALVSDVQIDEQYRRALNGS